MIIIVINGNNNNRPRWRGARPCWAARSRPPAASRPPRRLTIVHPVRNPRFVSFRSQPLENLYLLKKGFWATQPLEQILVAEFLLCELGVSRWTTLGSLVEMCRFGHKSRSRASILNWLAYAWNTEGHGFIEFEMSNSSASTVFRQPLSVRWTRTHMHIYIYIYIYIYIHSYSR